MSERASHAVRIKEPTVEPGIVLLPKQKVPDSHALITQQDEPFTDETYNDVSRYEVPIAVIHPGASPFPWMNISFFFLAILLE